MTKQLSEAESKQILGVAGQNTRNGNINSDDFLPELRGKRAIRKYREMRMNNATVGAVLYAVEQMLRDVDIKVQPTNDSDQAKREARFVEEVLKDMDHTLDDHISEALSFLTYGFHIGEVVYKRRQGPDFRSPKKKSKYSDGRIGVRKIASRAPWTISKFDVDNTTGEILGVWQDVSYGTKGNYIPFRKCLYYRSTSINNDPSGQSILRNAYQSYEYLNNIQMVEAVAIERELNGIPVGRIPAEYLSSDATDDQLAVKNQFTQVLRDVKFNEQGYILLPSDTYPGKEGEPTDIPLMDIRLLTSDGTRNIDIDPVVKRYQRDIARSVLSEFLMLGDSSAGSYALSKDKTTLFLRALESYIQTVVDVLQKQLLERLWELNGLNYDLMPQLTHGDVAPRDIKELAAFLRNINNANIDVSSHPETVTDLMRIADVEFDPSTYTPNISAEEQ